MATQQLTLRTGHPRDITAVDALMAAAFDPRYGEAWSHGQVLGILAMPGVRLTLAYADDEPAGFSLVRTVLDEAELLLLAVAPTHRRRGVGGGWRGRRHRRDPPGGARGQRGEPALYHPWLCQGG
jgi:[ribosomal protein S18]-alanine N-acetyltransferase